MTRREMLNSCLSGCVSGSLILVGGLLSAQQPRQQPGRATLNPGRGGSTAAQPAGQQDGQPARVERPSQQSMETVLPKELEELLVQWEVQSNKIERLQGEFTRYVYDMVYFGETRAAGRFYYEKPDHGRMDFAPADLTDPPRRTADNRSFTLQNESHQRWICTGQVIYIINDDQKLYDLVKIPSHLQGQNIINGPLPFLFGMKADQAKSRYILRLGDKHWPQGKIVTDDKGKEVQLAPQLHVIAAPKLVDDRKEWSRAEVLLTPEFLPRAIRLVNPTGSKETVYLFFPGSKMVVNQRFWGNDPFNDKPHRSYKMNSETRASDEGAVTGTNRVLPAAGQKSDR